LIKLSDESLKLIFYDPAEPSRTLLFDTLPKGIVFDDLNATFCTSPLLIVWQVFYLCLAFAAIPMITLAVIIFLC